MTRRDLEQSIDEVMRRLPDLHAPETLVPRALALARAYLAAPRVREETP